MKRTYSHNNVVKSNNSDGRSEEKLTYYMFKEIKRLQKRVEKLERDVEMIAENYKKDTL